MHWATSPGCSIKLAVESNTSIMDVFLNCNSSKKDVKYLNLALDLIIAELSHHYETHSILWQQVVV